MADGDTRGRASRKKRVARAELDELLYLHAQSLLGDAPAPPEEDSDPDLIRLGYSLQRAYDLWNAWDKHGVMPRRGGYDDQPRRWLKMIRVMNRRFNRAYAAARDEHEARREEDADSSRFGGGRSEREIDPAEFMGSPLAASGGRPSWEQFRGG